MHRGDHIVDFNEQRGVVETISIQKFCGSRQMSNFIVK